MYKERRIIAKIIDIAIIIITILLITYFVIGTRYYNASIFLSLITIFIYFTIFGSYFSGSFGKKIMGIAVTRKDNNQPPDSVHLLFREPILIGLIGALISLSIGSVIFKILNHFNLSILGTLILWLIIIIIILYYLVTIIMFFINKDWWNEKYNISLIKKKKVY